MKAVAPLLAVFVAVPLVMLLLARLGGWAALAERYPASVEPARPRYCFGYGVFRGWCGYKGCLVVSADQRGFFLSVWPFFSFGHAPIFIPWSEVREISEARVFCWPVHRIVTLRAPEIDFALYGRAFEFIRPAAEAAGVAFL